jgi:hypothetical protein
MAFEQAADVISTWVIKGEPPVGHRGKYAAAADAG